jgi:hypothetical protein
VCIPGHDHHFALQAHGRAADAADAVDVEEGHEPKDDVILAVGNAACRECALEVR